MSKKNEKIWDFASHRIKYGKKKTPAKAGAKRSSTSAIPEWCTTSTIAKLIGKSDRWVQELVKSGVLSTEIPPEGGTRKYKTAETMQAYIEYVKEKAQGDKSAANAEELKLEKLCAEVNLKESQGRLYKLKTEVEEGNFVRAESAQKAVSDYMSVFRKFVLAIGYNLLVQQKSVSIMLVFGFWDVSKSKGILLTHF